MISPMIPTITAHVRTGPCSRGAEGPVARVKRDFIGILPQA